jgi:hypothetical protein
MCHHCGEGSTVQGDPKVSAGCKRVCCKFSNTLHLSLTVGHPCPELSEHDALPLGATAVWKLKWLSSGKPLAP